MKYEYLRLKYKEKYIDEYNPEKNIVRRELKRKSVTTQLNELSQRGIVEVISYYLDPKDFSKDVAVVKFLAKGEYT